MSSKGQFTSPSALAGEKSNIKVAKLSLGENSTGVHLSPEEFCNLVQRCNIFLNEGGHLTEGNIQLTIHHKPMKSGQFNMTLLRKKSRVKSEVVEGQSGL